jgi:hypothetical protein
MPQQLRTNDRMPRVGEDGFRFDTFITSSDINVATSGRLPIGTDVK